MQILLTHHNFPFEKTSCESVSPEVRQRIDGIVRRPVGGFRSVNLGKDFVAGNEFT